MKIKKLGHCCLIIEENGKRIMTDPGMWTVEEQEKEKNIDLIIITHEHQDHLHIESLKKIAENNPAATIITNESVGKLLDKEGIKYEIPDYGTPTDFLGIEIEALNCKHEEIYREIAQVENTGFFIGKRLFYPGDSFYSPTKPVEILALPVAGPWMNIKSAIDYALKVEPKICFPVHDGMLISPGPNHRVPTMVLEKSGISFVALEEGEKEF